MKRLFTTLCAVLLFTTVSYQQSTIERAQSELIYDIASLTVWPAKCETGPFLIGVLADPVLSSELKIYLNDKKIGSQKIQVVDFKTPEEIMNCHVLFIPFSKTRLIPVISKYIEGSNTLLITERYGALEAGSAVNFVIVQERIKFEVSSENASRYGIAFNAALDQLAAQIP